MDDARHGPGHAMSTGASTLTFVPDGDLADFEYLLAQILSDRSTDDRVAALDAEPGAWDEELYGLLVEAGILAALVGDADDPGLGAQGLLLLARQAGRTLARTPLVASAVTALAAARAGRHDLAESIAAGEVRVAVAEPADLDHVALTDRLRGHVGYVTHATPATHHLVLPVDGSPVLVPTSAPGVTTRTTGWGYTEDLAVTYDVAAADLTVLDDVPSHDVRSLWRTALAALVTGAGLEAVTRTAAYVSDRHQFGVPLSTKQGVAHRAADAYIDTECIWLTALNAAVLADTPGTAAHDVTRASLEAAWWAGTGGVRAVHAAQHLHGGTGADTDNHIHRFFTFVRGLAVTLGPADRLLENLGDVLVAHPPVPREGGDA